MRAKWRLPTVMELALLMELQEFQSYIYVWSSTPYNVSGFVTNGPYWAGNKEYDDKQSTYWAGNKQHGEQHARYKLMSPEEVLECILVRTNGENLNWSKVHYNYSHNQARHLCNISSKYVKTVYTTLRAKVCYEA